jgi:hypothetical protein
MPRNCDRMALILCVLSLLSDSFASGQELTSSTHTSKVLAEFDVAKYGDVLLLPVTLGDHRLQFLVSTNSTHTIFDSRLRAVLDRPVDDAFANTSEGRRKIETFQAPEARVGTLPLELPGQVLYYDLSFVRTTTGHSVDGVLGLDFLKQYTLQVDFDRGKLRFLSAAPPDLGLGRPLVYSRDANLPQVSVNVPGVGTELFTVNLGSMLRMGLERRTFNDLCERGRIRIVSEAKVKNEVGSVHTLRLALLPELTLGDARMKDLVVTDSAVNVLGLDFLRRFHLTLDFPSRRAYFQPGERVGDAGHWNRNGLRCLSQGGEVVVAIIDEGSPAREAGFALDDVIVRVNDQPIDSFTLLQLRMLLQQEGETVRMTVRRGTEFLNFTVVQRDYYRPPVALDPAFRP